MSQVWRIYIRESWRYAPQFDRSFRESSAFTRNLHIFGKRRGLARRGFFLTNNR
jgi:hypothetical protein